MNSVIDEAARNHIWVICGLEGGEFVEVKKY